jgi:hypothetical protein
MRKLDREILVPFGLAALCIGVYFAVFVPPTLHDVRLSLTSNSDLQSYFLPKYAFGSDELLRGRLPVWNLYEFGGLPFLATVQPAVFYPPKVLLFALLPPTAAYWIYLVGHYLLAAFGFIAFARELGLRREAALVGAVTLIFSVPILVSNYHPTRIANLAWLPLAFLFATRILKGAGLKAFVGLAVVLVMQLHAGYPEFTLHAAQFLAIYILATWLAEAPRRPKFVPPLVIAGAFVVALSISAVVVLPFLQAGAEAERSRVAALAQESMQASSDIWRTAYVTFGLFVPGLAAFTLLSATSRKGLAALISVVAGAILFLQLSALKEKLMIRYPMGVIISSMFLPAWAAALGCDSFLRAPEAPPRTRRLVIGLAIGGALIAVVIYLARLPRLFRGESVQYQTLGGCLLALFGSALLLASAVSLRKNASISGKLLLGAVPVLVISQLTAFPYGHAPAAVNRPGRTGEIKRLLGSRPPPEGRVFSFHDLLYGYNLTDRLPSVLGIEESLLPWRFRQIRDEVQLVHFFGSIDTAQLARMPGFLDAMNLEYIAVDRKVSARFEVLGYRRAGHDDRSILLENPRRMGTAWVNYNVHKVDYEHAAFRYVTSKSFDPRLAVVVSDALAATYPEKGAGPSTSARAVRRPSPTELEVDVELARPGVLVVSEAAYPGWRATVNGKRARWVEANYVMRGVELGPGSHLVRFEYEPRSLTWGAVISLAGIAFLGGAWLFDRRRKRKTEAAP